MPAIEDGELEAADFVAIGEDVFLCRGNEGVDNNSRDPTVILIFGWMSAQLPHLLKYTETYNKLYPGATLILIRCKASIFWKTQRTREALLRPVIETLEALGCIVPQSYQAKGSKTTLASSSPPPPHRILVHTFSNGGSYQLSTLSKMLSGRQTSSPHVTSAIILDSCPGGAGLSLALRAFTSHLRNPLLRVGVTVLILALYLYGMVSDFLLRRRMWLLVLKETLHNPRMLPWTDPITPRLYVFSRSDKMVPWQQVQMHADEAIARGLKVRTEVYEASPHVAHARTDPTRYWAAVSELWKAASEAG